MNTIRIAYQGQEIEMNSEDFYNLLNNSNLPWFKDDSNIFVVGWNDDLELRLG